MHAFVTTIVTQAALTSGLTPDRVMEQAKDNLTIERPRVELQFLPENYTRSGRKLAACRKDNRLIRKHELYTVRLNVAVNVLADDATWLEQFCPAFAAALPTGANDSRGNWVQIRVTEAKFGKESDKRVGNAVISVFTKIHRLFNVAFTWRVTAEEEERLILTYTINPEWKGAHHA